MQRERVVRHSDGDENGASCSNITGATSKKYALTADDVGNTLRVRVTGTNSVGSSSVVSAVTGLAQAKFDPSAEFELKPWISIHLGSLDMSINKAVVYILIGGALTCLMGIGLMRLRLGVRAERRQTVGEMIYDVAQTQVAETGLPSKAIGLWFPYVASLMLSLLLFFGGSKT